MDEQMDKKTLYLECYSGISGDTTVAALLDLGADKDVLMAGLDSLNVEGYRVEIGRRTKKSIDACDFNVILDAEEHSSHNHEEDGHGHSHGEDEHVHNHEDHDHVHHHEEDGHGHSHEGDNHGHSHEEGHEHSNNHEDGSENNQHRHFHRGRTSIQLGKHNPAYIHAQLHGHSHDHDHDHDHDNDHDHSHTHDHIHMGHHEHRNLYEINSIIEKSDITDNAKDIAKRIFHIIAVAESKAHGKPVEEVHFHEVGAVDSIVDIVATAICLDNLNIQDVIVSELYEGTGQIRCQHGIIPVPVPAVANIATEHNLLLHLTSVKGEMVTPTGAGIVAAIRTKDTLPKNFKVLKIGLGAGKKDFEHANVLRAMFIEDTSTQTGNSQGDKVWVLEANIDDCSGEALSMAMDLLFQNGAKDVYYSPIYMKKNRPAYLLGVICGEEDIEKMEEVIFTHTSTIGIRKHETIRTILKRDYNIILTPYGKATVKICTYHEKKFYYPEFESVKKLCVASGEDYISMYSLVQNLAKGLEKANNNIDTV